MSSATNRGSLLTRRNRWKRLFGYRFWVGWCVRIIIPATRRLMNFLWHITVSMWTVGTIFAVTSALITKEKVVQGTIEVAMGSVEIWRYLRLSELCVKIMAMIGLRSLINIIGGYTGFEIQKLTIEYGPTGNSAIMIVVIVVCWKLAVETLVFFKQWAWNISQDSLLNQEPASWTEAINVLVWVVLAGVPVL